MNSSNTQGLDLFLMLFVCIVSFMAYWFTIESNKIREWFERRYGKDSTAIRFFAFNKLWGTLWFGVICTLAAFLIFPGSTVADFGFRLPSSGSPAIVTLVSTATLSLLLVAANFYRSRKIGKNGTGFGRYPEIRLSVWSYGTVALDAGLWSLYLLAYELMFRGTLFLPLVGRLGLWPAIGVNIALYSAVHVPKGAGEAIGALILGFVLCFITFYTKSIATAFLVHAALAVSNDLFAFCFRPDMRLKRNTTISEVHR